MMMIIYLIAKLFKLNDFLTTTKIKIKRRRRRNLQNKYNFFQLYELIAYKLVDEHIKIHCIVILPGINFCLMQIQRHSLKNLSRDDFYA